MKIFDKIKKLFSKNKEENNKIEKKETIGDMVKDILSDKSKKYIDDFDYYETYKLKFRIKEIILGDGSQIYSAEKHHYDWGWNKITPIDFHLKFLFTNLEISPLFEKNDYESTVKLIYWFKFYLKFISFCEKEEPEILNTNYIEV